MRSQGKLALYLSDGEELSNGSFWFTEHYGDFRLTVTDSSVLHSYLHTRRDTFELKYLTLFPTN